MKALAPIFSAAEMHYCSVPVPSINAHKGGEFDFTEEQIANYGQSQTHPSIIYIPDGWNGHKYWLASTPYPKSEGVFENACIYYGDEINGNPPLVFTPISGTVSGDYTVINNPIVKIPNRSTVNSDPDLFFDSDNSRMIMISRENSNNYAVYPQFSLTGQAWTPRDQYLWKKGAGELVNKPEFLSPAIVKKDNKFRIYSLSGTGGIYPLNYRTNRGICWGLYIEEGTTFEDGGDFSLLGKGSILGKRGIEPWHMDMFKDVRTDYLYMIFSAKNNLLNTADVYLAESKDWLNFTIFSRPLISGIAQYRPTAALRESDNMLIVYWSTTNAPQTAASYPNGASDVPVDGRAIGLSYRNFDDILTTLRKDKVYGWLNN